jgi:HAD superfamily hydrolase (TIGR01490 family)
VPTTRNTEFRGLAFYDFDGTIVSTNVVHQYVWLARRIPSYWRLLLVVVSAPLLKTADLISRALFNRIFYRHYQGLEEDWLRQTAHQMIELYLGPKVFGGVRGLLDQNRQEGYANILITGGLDFAMEPLARGLGFDRVLANRLEFANGRATGRLLPPVLAGEEKARSLQQLAREYNIELSRCRAYSDDESDLPMLEAVGEPIAANPKPGLRRRALQRRWQVIEL